MKVLIVHNDYGKYSGEEVVVDNMAIMLQNLGYEVAQLRNTTANSRESVKGKIHGFLSGIYCPSGIKAMRKTLEHEKPDVINVHNLYPFISPAALRECKRAGVPVVMTIHNFRLMCPTGLFMRNNQPCELCLEKGNEWGCIKYNCEHSLLKSIGYAARNAMARTRRHFIDCVDIFSCITAFQRQKLIQAGFPEDKLVVIPNSVDVPAILTPTEGSYVAYSGRISREKGVDMIIDVARQHPEIPFKLAGAIRDESLVNDLPTNVELSGYLSGNTLAEFYRNARFFVMASRCYEGFPMTILEAASYAKPMIAPDHGGFSEIVGRGDDAIGMLTIPSDVESFDNAITTLWESPSECSIIGQKAFNKLKNEYSTEVISQQWDHLLTMLKQ